MEVAAALALLEHAEGDGGRGAPGAEDFPSLVALASTCRALRGALQLHRAQLAQACWLRAFGAESLGACAAWQRTEQLGRSAFEARWRWLHGLRTSSSLTRVESTVEHVLPNRAQLKRMEFQLGRQEFDLAFDRDDPTQLGMWHPSTAALTALGASLLEAFVITADDLRCRVAFALRTGSVLHITIGSILSRSEVGLVTFGGIGVKLQHGGHSGDPVELLDLTANVELHVLRRSVVAPPIPGAQSGEWATNGTWSVDGTRLALWGKPGTSALGPAIAVYVFKIDAADAPPLVPLEPAHTLLVPKFLSLAFGGGGRRVYTAEADGSAGALKAWEIASGQLIAEAPLAYEQPAQPFVRRATHIVIVPFKSELCMSMNGCFIDVRCTATLQHVGRLQHAPLLGGHGKRVVALSGVADVLLSCDAGGTVLAWHVPTRQLLHRLGRDVITAPPAGAVFCDKSALGLTSRGVAVLEADDLVGQSGVRLFDWLP